MGINIQISNPVDLVAKISRAAKSKQRDFLEAIEIGHNTLSYEELRKLYLDNTNDILREIVCILFGQEFTELFIAKKNAKKR